MVRPREFDQDAALQAAIDVFRAHGFAATSAEMLTRAMGIGRQSLYDTFGDKWKLYCSAVKRYADSELRGHRAALCVGPRAIDGIQCMIERVVTHAHEPCLGISATVEFAGSHQDLYRMREAARRSLHAAVLEKIRQGQDEGDVTRDHTPGHLAAFVLAQVAAIRIAARGGAAASEVSALGRLALRALK